MQFLQVPLFLAFWGVDRYGEWIVLTGIPMTLSLLDFGVTQASANKCTMEAGAENWEAARNTLQTARCYTWVVSLLVVLSVALSTLVVDWSSILKLHHTSRHTASLVMIIFGATLAVQLQGGYLDAWMRSYGRAALSGFISPNTRVLDTLISAVLLISGAGFEVIAGGMLFSSLIIRLIHMWMAKKSAPQELSSFGKTSWLEFRSIVKPSVGYMGFPLTQMLTIQGGIQMLNQLASAEVVVAFTMTRTLMRLLMQIGVVCNNALKVEVSWLIGNNQLAAAIRLTKRVTEIAGGAGIVGYGCLVITGPAILSIWSHGRVVETGIFMALVGLHAVLNLLWFIPASFQIAGNKHTRLAAIYGSAAVVSLLLWISLKNMMSPITGASLLLAIPEGIILLFLLSKYLFEEKPNKKLI